MSFNTPNNTHSRDSKQNQVENQILDEMELKETVSYKHSRLSIYFSNSWITLF